jgi:hypothetical protein
MRSAHCQAARRAMGSRTPHTPFHLPPPARYIDGPATSGDAVDSLEFARGVKVPDDLASFGRIRPQVAV